MILLSVFDKELTIVSISVTVSACRAGLKPMQPMQLHWAPRHGVWADYSFCQTHLALENSVETPYKFHC